MATKEFTTGIVLELMTGKDVYGSYGDDNVFRRVTKLTEFTLGSVQDAYASLEEIDRARHVLVDQHSWLKEIQPPSDDEVAGDKNAFRRWTDRVSREHGRNLDVRGG